MASFNKVILMGNLTRDPELRVVGSGTQICKAGLAVNDRFKDSNGEWQDKAHFVDITIFGARGEAFSRYLSKGKPVLIEGRLDYSTWESENGDKRSKLEVVANNWEFVGPREGGGGGTNYGENQGTQAAPAQPVSQAAGTAEDPPF